MTDSALLTAVLALDDLDDARRAAFEDMQTRARPLTPKQRAWAEATLAGVRYEPPVEYENLVSSGKVPRGREVTVNVGALPKRPPGKTT